jgi:3-hydroxyacyl-[acyl-carrier-protein] dehydratase
MTGEKSKFGHPMNDPSSDALALLPHGPEFRFIDRVVKLVPGVEATGELTLRGDEAYLRGHFPGDPIMPGVLLVEAAAQLAGVAAQSDPNQAPLSRLKLADIRGARFQGAARPGDMITVEASVSGRMGRLIQARASASVRGVVILKCEVTLAGE